VKPAVAFALLSMAFLAGCSGDGSASEAPVEVETVVVSCSDISRTVEFSALLEAGSEAFLLSPGGILQRIAVREGDSVTAGEIIAEMSGDASLWGTVTEAEAGLRAALTMEERAANDANRSRQLFEAGAVSEAALSGAMAASTAAEAAVERARLARAAALAGVRTGVLTAPFDGTVGTVRGRRGELSSPGDIVASVIGEGLTVRLLVPERYLLEIRPGMTAMFQPALREYPSLEGAVESVARSVDPLTGLVPLTARFPAGEGAPVPPGISGVLSIELAQARGAVVIPADAVLMAGGIMQVPVLDEHGRVDLRTVEVGIQSGDSIQLTSGVGFGEEVILSSSARLTQGLQAVRRPF